MAENGGREMDRICFSLAIHEKRVLRRLCGRKSGTRSNPRSHTSSRLLEPLNIYLNKGNPSDVGKAIKPAIAIGNHASEVKTEGN